MTTARSTGALAPFRHRSFRVQWLADLSTSWAFEMETIMLSWYILVETQSVFLLTLFASVQFLGTLFSPLFGVMGHRLGNKRVYCAMRACYLTLALIMMTLVLTRAISPLYVFIIWTLLGLVRPSDLVLRYSLIGETMPQAQLMAATSVSRTTQDSARVMGALAGAGIVALLGMGVAYLAVAALYAASLALSLRVDNVRAAAAAPAAKDSHGRPAGHEAAPALSLWRDLRDGAVYVWHSPPLLAAMLIAFQVNLTAYPLTNGLLPHVAKDVFATDQTGLGYLSASFAFGALLGSIFLSRAGHALPPARMMVGFCTLWYAMLLVFAVTPNLAAGIVVLIVTGLVQSLGMVTMSAMLLQNTQAQYRGHVMGIRMLMIYSLPIGLLASGPLITHFSYRAMATLYCAIGIACMVWIGLKWRNHVWRHEAPANRR